MKQPIIQGSTVTIPFRVNGDGLALIRELHKDKAFMGNKYYCDCPEDAERIAEIASTHRAGGGPKRGGTNPNAGRPMTNLRSLDISQIGAELDPPPEYYSCDIMGMGKCGVCGSVWWEGFSVNGWESDGDGYKIAVEGEIEGQKERHSPSCPHR